jgi:predicted acyltransferase
MSNSASTAVPTTSGNRIASLDQFRGYTVVGMLLVNFIGGFSACPTILKHSHDYNSYADTIMPHFLFAVGFAFRLTFGRRAQSQGLASAYGRAVRRMLGLMLVAVVIYQVPPRASTWEQFTEMSFWDIFGEPLKRHWFATLMHIAVTGLWLIPVIRSSTAVRLLWMIGSAIAHIGLSYWFNYVWVNTGPNGIDGGPLGFLTWTIPATVGTFACDAVASADERPKFGRLVGWSIVIMALGYAISCGTRFYDVPADQVEALSGQKLATDPVLPPADVVQAKLKSGDISSLLAEPPFVPPPDAKHRKWNYWMMSQRGGTVSYLTFSAGFSLLVYILFYLVCDELEWKLPLVHSFFQTFGTNALLAYIIHDIVGTALERFMPKDSKDWYVWSGVALFFAINWLFLRQFQKQGVYLRV